jgi:hypothetical protein
MRVPNLFILGAPKCGTTSLAQWLSDHPNIFFPKVKEPFFFSKDVYQKIKNWKDYENLFKGVSPSHRIIGEASTHYLFSDVTVPSIEDHYSDPSYIVMIRNPIEMAYSLHGQHYYAFNENIKDFQKAWRLSPERRKGRLVPPKCQSHVLLDYQSFCLLGEQLERLFNRVARERVHIVTLDDIKRDTRKEYLDTLAFLQLSDDGREDFPVYNQAKQWKFPWMGRVIRFLSMQATNLKHIKGVLPKKSFGILATLRNSAIKKEKRSELSNNFRKELEAFYYSDVKKLSGILQRDFLLEWGYSDSKKLNSHVD